MIRNRRAAALFLLAAFAPVLGVPREAVAQTQGAPQPANPSSLPTRRASFAWDNTLLRAGFSFRDVVDKPLAEKLSSGLPNVILMRAYVFEEGRSEPVALAVRTCTVTYDLWDDIYRVRVSDPNGVRNVPKINVDGVLRECAEAHDLPIVDRAILEKGHPHFLGVLVEVNPISPAMLQQIRQWVQRPTGSTGINPGDALFGSFVGIFVRQIGTSAASLSFRTQSFTP
jgi:hypothetical protein